MKKKHWRKAQIQHEIVGGALSKLLLMTDQIKMVTTGMSQLPQWLAEQVDALKRIEGDLTPLAESLRPYCQLPLERIPLLKKHKVKKKRK